MEFLGWSIGPSTLVIGALTGLAYGVLAVGIVLIYRATRVVNFAHGEIGAFSAAVLALLVLDHQWNFFAALAVAAVVGGAVGGVWERIVVRKLFYSARLILLVATIGISQVMLAAQMLLPTLDNPGPYPVPFDLQVEVAGVNLHGGHVFVLALAPVMVAALAWFLQRTSYGTAIRASAENADAARLAGIDVHRVSLIVWAIAGVIAAVTIVMINPVRGIVAGDFVALTLGPGVLLRTLAAALIGGMVSLPLTVVGGVLIGATEAVLFVNVGAPGTVDALLFALLLVLVVARGKALLGERSGWSLTAPDLRLPKALRTLPRVRRLRYAGLVLAVGLAAVAPLVFTSPSTHFNFSRIVVYAVAALSVVVITGWAGQLSLAQYAFVGLGAVAVAGLTEAGVGFGAAALLAVVLGVVAAVVAGAPALRLRGMLLAITTLGFAVAAAGWLLPHDVFLTGSSAFVDRPAVGPFDFDDQRSYYYLSLAVLVVTIFAVGRLRETGAGRSIIAVRDNEQNAAALTISPTRTKLEAFALAGGLASLSGALLAGLLVNFRVHEFAPDQSLQVVAAVIIGGMGSVAGALVGSGFVVGFPALIGDRLIGMLGGEHAIVLLLSGGGLIAILLHHPGGIAHGLQWLREVIVTRLAGTVPAATGTGATASTGVAQPGAAPAEVALPSDTTAADASDPPFPDGALGGGTLSARLADSSLVVGQRGGEADAPGDALGVHGVTVRFGGLVANDGVDLRVGRGETVGLIGTNGAGKSTLVDAVNGFTPIDGGRVELLGQDVTDAPAHRRAALGVGRVFQDAALFPQLSVREAVGVALEAREGSGLVRSLLATPGSVRLERRRAAAVDEIIDLVGLGRYADSLIEHLSTGTRRIVELACLLAVDARLLLLDEPTAGVAQREVEAFAALIGEVRRALDAAILIVEHDIPLVMSISDRVYCLESGAVIAEGTPAEIREDPAVIASYLGSDQRAIGRSDVGASDDDADGRA